jgi:hypothetical protein
VTTGSLTFPGGVAGDGPQSQTVTIKRTVEVGSKGVSAAFVPNEYSHPTAAAKATCTF